MEKRRLGRSNKPTIENGPVSPITMDKGLGRLSSALCVLILLVTPVISESPTIDDAPQIIIDQNHGLIVDNGLNISGTYFDERLPNSFSWEIYNGILLIGEGDLTSSLTETEVMHESSRNSWGYSLDLNFSSYGSCSCLLEIKAIDTNNQISVEQLIIFSHGEEFSELGPQIIFDNPSQQLTGTVLIKTIAMDDAGDAEAQWAISNSSEIAMSCIHSLIESPESVDWNNMSSTPTSFPMWSLDTTNYDDGEYSLIIRAVSDDGLTSPCSCLTVAIDNTPPTAIMVVPVNISEGLDNILADGSQSSDQYWGRDSLVFLWLLEDEFGDKTIESGMDMRTFTIDRSQSGIYTLTLTVADEAGFSNTVSSQITITNQKPVAALRIAGQPLTDGDSVTLVDSNLWNIECGDSTDTANDQSGLTCTWHIDGVPVMTGSERQLEKPEDLSKPHTLMLEVTDDDGASDSITVTFGVQGTPSDPMFSDDSEDGLSWVIQGFGIFLISIFVGIFLYTRYNQHASSIPKWKRE